MHDEILKLKQLLDQGVLTEEEFTAAKRKLLGMDSSLNQPKEVSDPKPISKPVSPPSKSGFAPAPYKEESRPAYVSQAKSPKECPKCHEPIPQSALVCPGCGSSVNSINRSSKECPRCHRKYSTSETACPFCANEQEQNTSSNQRRFLILLVIAVLVFGFVYYIIEYNRNFTPSTYSTISTSESPQTTPPFVCSISGSPKTIAGVENKVSLDIKIENTSDTTLYIQLTDEQGNILSNTDSFVPIAKNATLVRSIDYTLTSDNIISSKIIITVTYCSMESQQTSEYSAVFSWDSKQSTINSTTYTPTATTSPSASVNQNYTGTPKSPTSQSSSSYKPSSTNKTNVSSHSSSKVSDDLKYALIDVTKKRVSNHLKAPSAAKFPSYKEWSVAKGEANVYNVIGYVDSQNSFGAMIRETVGAMIQYDGTYSSVVMIQIGDNIYLD